MKIARVFPRRTNATPTDDLAFIGGPPLFRLDVDEVHVSCAFTWDKSVAMRLACEWSNNGYKVKLGGPAYNARPGGFEPGLYVKPGMTITSRGCIRRCPFCLVPKREGALRLLTIKPGWDILDNNLLACPRPHIEAVLDMLEGQPHPARFTGGIDARLCEPWFAERLGRMRVDILYTAFDHQGERANVNRTIAMLRGAGLRQRAVGCFVLIGQAGDSLAAAEDRLEWVFQAGAVPCAMYYRPPDEKRFKVPHAWRDLVRKWNRPAIIFAAHAETLNVSRPSPGNKNRSQGPDGRRRAVNIGCPDPEKAELCRDALSKRVPPREDRDATPAGASLVPVSAGRSTVAARPDPTRLSR